VTVAISRALSPVDRSEQHPYIEVMPGIEVSTKASDSGDIGNVVTLAS
jgi:hypothetical protein